MMEQTFLGLCRRRLVGSFGGSHTRINFNVELTKALLGGGSGILVVLCMASLGGDEIFGTFEERNRAELEQKK